MAKVPPGMHFPAADIPEQARALYIINRIRILHDRVSENSRLVRTYNLLMYMT
jgi:light-regulated signal transduction histidine kinase (bacteriophytochrome)